MIHIHISKLKSQNLKPLKKKERKKSCGLVKAKDFSRKPTNFIITFFFYCHKFLPAIFFFNCALHSMKARTVNEFTKFHNSKLSIAHPEDPEVS